MPARLVRVNAFVDVIREFDAARYDFTLREEQTHEIIEDVAHMKSELGVLYCRRAIARSSGRCFVANELAFEPLFRAPEPHVFACSSHPLASRASVTLDDMADYPFLSYEQGSKLVTTIPKSLHPRSIATKNIRVRDRATLFNLLIGLNGYTVCSGVISAELNGASIISVPLDIDELWKWDWLRAKARSVRAYSAAYVGRIRRHIPAIGRGGAKRSAGDLPLPLWRILLGRLNGGPMLPFWFV